ncbi:MAG: hypothetical protein ABL966_04205 [Acidimicrobiales bacterium]
MSDDVQSGRPGDGVSRRDAVRLGLGLAGTVFLGGLWAKPAGAWPVSVYKTVGTTQVRNGPCVRSSQVATFAGGTTVRIVGQTGGSRFGGTGASASNATWNRLEDGRWIHDLQVSTPGGARTPLSDGLGGYTSFSPIPRVTPAILGRATGDSVAWWAETQLGVASYDGWCLAFADNAWKYGAKKVPTGSLTSAISRWTSLPAAGKSTSTTPTRGAICFWNKTTNNPYGHCAIAAGGGYVVSSYYGNKNANGSHIKTISWVKLTTVTATCGGKFLGWHMPG